LTEHLMLQIHLLSLFEIMQVLGFLKISNT
jgi:hypothetical protein